MLPALLVLLVLVACIAVAFECHAFALGCFAACGAIAHLT